MLLEQCGFDPFKGPDAIPPAWAYSRFLKVILRHSKEMVEIFQQLVGEVGEALPDFGEDLALDGKKLPTTRAMTMERSSSRPTMNWASPPSSTSGTSGRMARIRKW